jgi:hypothetical protein
MDFHGGFKDYITQKLHILNIACGCRWNEETLAAASLLQRKTIKQRNNPRLRRRQGHKQIG